MIKNDFIRIPTKGCRKLSHFLKLGYDISDDYINIKISDLNIGSRQLVDVTCDFCNKDVVINYREYLRNISIGNKYSCCNKCGSEKAKETNLKNIGVEYPMQLKSTQSKVRETNLDRYGVEFLQQSEEFKLKSKISIMSKYGVDHVSKSEEIRKITSKISLDNNYIKYISDNLSLFSCDRLEPHNFKISGDNYFHRKRVNLPLCTVCNPIGDSCSIKEKLLHEYIESIYTGEIIQSYRDGLEIDIYLPDLKIGFEFNGLYWHSDKFKDRNYHINKTNHFKERGIRIIHIWEDDWTTKGNIIKSQISNWLGLNVSNIFARNCVIVELDDVGIVREFLDTNHIQGYSNSVVKIGLMYNSDLVCLMTFDRNEGRKKMDINEWNLSRFCNKLNTSVVGGSSRILKYFITKYSPKRIISYSDSDWSVGALYYKLGFSKVSETIPDYKYIIDDVRTHKSRFRRSKLNTDLTESMYMKSMSINKIYDCGKTKFEIIYK